MRVVWVMSQPTYNSQMWRDTPPHSVDRRVMWHTSRWQHRAKDMGVMCDILSHITPTYTSYMSTVTPRCSQRKSDVNLSRGQRRAKDMWVMCDMWAMCDMWVMCDMWAMCDTSHPSQWQHRAKRHGSHVTSTRLHISGRWVPWHPHF